MSSISQKWFERFDKRPRFYAFCMLLLYLFINNTINATSDWMEASRGGQIPEFQLWEPFLWEYTSLISTLCLLPCLIWWYKKVPFSLSRFARFFVLTFIATVVFSILHVAIMVALREIAYAMIGSDYNFGNVWIEFIYEYRKDAWGYLFFMALYYAYTFIYSRLKGEASLIQEQDNNGHAQIKSDDADGAIAADFTPEFLLVKKLDREFLVKIADIEWLESAGNYVNLHAHGRIYPLRSTMTKLLAKLEQQGFAQTHRSYGVNYKKIDNLSTQASGDGEITMQSGAQVALSRRYKDAFKAKFDVQ